MAKKLAIIGGGAAGLAAAIAAGRLTATAGVPGGCDVVLYERDDRVGRSILATGNGRCNFSNAQMDASVYRNAEFVDAAFRELAELRAAGCNIWQPPCGDTALNPVLQLFSDLGLVWREEGEGRLYPAANKASVVLDVLRSETKRLGVREACEHKLTALDAPQRSGERFHLRFSDGAVEHADAVIVTCGGNVLEGLLPGSFAVMPQRPVLGPLRTDTARTRVLDNIRVRCAVELARAGSGKLVAREQGELLFRKYGVSGIAVFNLSRFAEPGDTLLVDFLPSVDARDCESWLSARHKRMTAQGASPTGMDFLRGLLLPAVSEVVLKQAGLVPEAAFSKKYTVALVQVLKAFPLTVEGIGDARQCQVTRGGYQAAAFDARTMEARELPGLHVAGEALDVDAPCGGFNLHWAWASGLLAGAHAAAYVGKEAAHA